MSGRLFIVSTPIGNLGDISPRVKEALSASFVVLAEDTRISKKLLFHCGISTPLLSCHEFNEQSRLKTLEEAVANDASISIICDSGTPLISDPGYQIVKAAIELGMTVSPIPGPSAALAALVGSGLPAARFAFEGFLPDKAGDRQKRLEDCKSDQRTLIYYVAPSNLLVVLKEMLSVFGDRRACLARELTKLHEEFIRGTLATLIAHIEKHGTRGEYVLVINGLEGIERQWTKEEVVARLTELLSCGGRLKEVSGLLAKETGWSSSEIYKLGLASKETNPDQ